MSDKLILAGGDVVTPERVIQDGVVGVQNGVIRFISSSMPAGLDSSFKQIDCQGKMVMAGFIDVHTHGGMGLDFADDDPTVTGRLSEYYYRHGTTTLLATLCSLPVELMISALRRVAAFCHDKGRDTNIYGVHIEGPYLNKLMRGGNAEANIEAPEYDSWTRIKQAGEGYIRLMTIAPELRGIERIMQDALQDNIVISLGHSTASGNATARAIAAGATQATHLFNGMPGLHHREPGMLAEILMSDKVDAQIIADGVHVDPKIIQLALRLKTSEHIMLITDSMRAAQLSDGEYPSAGNVVRVEGGVSRLKDGTLAGSTLVFESGVRMVVQKIGVDLPAASRMASLNAARSLGIHHYTGSIETDKAADLVVLDRQFNVWMTIHQGNVKYQAFSQ